MSRAYDARGPLPWGEAVALILARDYRDATAPSREELAPALARGLTAGEAAAEIARSRGLPPRPGSVLSTQLSLFPKESRGPYR